MQKVYSIKEAQVTIGEFFLKLLHSATNTHIHHLQTKSYAQHQALGSFYDSIIELTDSLIESYQGRMNVIVEYPTNYDAPKVDGIAELDDLSSYVIANRSVVGSYSELQNLIDEIQDEINSTIYKLKNLK